MYKQMTVVFCFHKMLILYSKQVKQLNISGSNCLILGLILNIDLLLYLKTTTKNRKCHYHQLHINNQKSNFFINVFYWSRNDETNVQESTFFFTNIHSNCQSRLWSPLSLYKKNKIIISQIKGNV